MADKSFVKSRICTKRKLDKLYLFLMVFFSLETILILSFARITGSASWFYIFT